MTTVSSSLITLLFLACQTTALPLLGEFSSPPTSSSTLHTFSRRYCDAYSETCGPNTGVIIGIVATVIIVIIACIIFISICVRSSRRTTARQNAMYMNSSPGYAAHNKHHTGWVGAGAGIGGATGLAMGTMAPPPYDGASAAITATPATCDAGGMAAMGSTGASGSTGGGASGGGC